MSSYPAPRVKLVGNVRDLLAMCYATSSETGVRIGGWVLELGASGYTIRVRPMYEDRSGPFEMRLYSPEGVELKTSRGIASVERSVEGALTSLRGARIDVPNAGDLLAIARGLDGGTT